MIIKNKDQKIGGILLTFSVIFIIISEFVIWTGNYSVFNLITVTDYDQNFWVYLFPIVGAIFIICAILGLFYIKKSKKIVFYIGLIIALNFLLFFLAEMFFTHGKYLWKNPGIYFFIIGFLSLLVGLLYLLSFFSKIQEQEHELNQKEKQNKKQKPKNQKEKTKSKNDK